MSSVGFVRPRGAFALATAVVTLGLSLGPASGVSALPQSGSGTASMQPALGARGPVLFSVRAFSPTDVWGVGTQPAGTLVSPDPIDAFAAHYDGSSWTTVATPSPSRYNRLVSLAGDSTSDLWAVGSTENKQGLHEPLAEHWDGSSWTVGALPDVGPDGGVLSSVAVISPDDAWAVGHRGAYDPSQGAILDHWDGTTWTEVQAPHSADADFYSITAVSATDVWLLRSGAHFGDGAEHWDGSTWTVVKTTAPHTNFANAVTAISTDDVWAVGFRHEGAIEATMTEHWDGSRWTRIPSPNVAGTPFQQLVSVSGISANDVWAVGYASINGHAQTLTEHWDGTRWAIVASPNPRPATDYAFAVSQDSADDAWLVGAKSERGASFVEQWNGTAWKPTRPF